MIPQKYQLLQQEIFDATIRPINGLWINELTNFDSFNSKSAMRNSLIR